MSLNEWLSRYSNSKIAFFAISIGILLILYFNPLYDVCDAQKEIFIQDQKKFMNLTPLDANTARKPSEWKKFMEYCRSTNTPGGCYELFSKTRQWLYDLESMPLKCSLQLKGVQEIKVFVFSLIRLMVFLAWGDFPSQDEDEKFSWFKKDDLYLFCKLKESIKKSNLESWNHFELSVLKKLPNIEKLSKNKIYNLSLFSHPCDF